MSKGFVYNQDPRTEEAVNRWMDEVDELLRLVQRDTKVDLPEAISLASATITGTLGTMAAQDADAVAITGGTAALDSLFVDEITERTTGNGILIDGVTLKDGFVAAGNADNTTSWAYPIYLSRGDGSGTDAVVATLGDGANGVYAVGIGIGGSVPLYATTDLIQCNDYFKIDNNHYYTFNIAKADAEGRFITWNIGSTGLQEEVGEAAAIGQGANGEIGFYYSPNAGAGGAPAWADLLKLNPDKSAMFYGDVIVRSAEPSILLRDTDCAVDQNGASIYAAATDTGSGTEDIDVHFQQRINGIIADWLHADADGYIRLERSTYVNGPLQVAQWIFCQTLYSQSTNPRLIFRDTSCTDKYGDRAYISVNCTDTGFGTEDASMYFSVDIDGTITQLMSLVGGGTPPRISIDTKLEAQNYDHSFYGVLRVYDNYNLGGTNPTALGYPLINLQGGGTVYWKGPFIEFERERPGNASAQVGDVVWLLHGKARIGAGMYKVGDYILEAATDEGTYFKGKHKFDIATGPISTETVLTIDTNDIAYRGRGLNASHERAELEAMFKAAQSTKYTEYTYTGSELTGIDVWDTASKTTKLFTKVISYDAGNVDQITITDEVASTTLTKTFTYSGGNIATKTEAVA